MEETETEEILNSVEEKEGEPIAEFLFPLHDIGNAERFVQQQGTNLKFCPEWKVWLIYTAGQWEIQQSKSRLYQMGKKTIQSMYEEAKREDLSSGQKQALIKHAGSRKDLGCFYIVGKNNRKMALCESAIDAASFAVLYPEYTAISTSGATANPAWLENFIANGCDIYCGFDADETGDTMANKMIKRYPSIKRLRPSKHDWNEVLQSNSL